MKSIYLFAGLSIVFLSFGFVRTDDSTQKTVVKNIPLGKAEIVETEIEFVVGRLNIRSSATQLTEGTYKFYKEMLKPEFSYSEEGKIGHLSITSKKGHIEMDDDNDNHNDNECLWDIALNKKVKHDLTVKLTAGNGNIDLSGCQLKRFEFKMVAGEAKINLSNTSVPEVNFKAMAGNAVIDLSGKWNNDLHARIKGGVGEITLKLPADIGIKMNITGVLGSVNTKGLYKMGQEYSNDLLGKTKQTLYIDVTGGIGNVNVKLVE